jgi:hypothetical protein
MSRDDHDAERGHAAQALMATGLPLVGMTLAGDGAGAPGSGRGRTTGSGRYRSPESVSWARGSVSTYDDELMPVPAADGRLVRTVSARSGRAQADLARLHVGVVGAVSVGSMVAEALARLGIARTTLLDFDSVDLHNLDRCLHVTQSNIGKASAYQDGTSCGRLSDRRRRQAR